MGQAVWSTCLGPSLVDQVLKSNLGPWTWWSFTNGCIMSLLTPTTSPVWFWIFWMGQWLIQLERGAKPVILQKSLEFILYTCDLPVYRKIAHDNMLLYIRASWPALGDCMRCLYNADFLRWRGWNVSQRLVGVDNLWGDPCLFLFSPPITSCI